VRTGDAPLRRRKFCTIEFLRENIHAQSGLIDQPRRDGLASEAGLASARNPRRIDVKVLRNIRFKDFRGDPAMGLSRNR
jgi:hypothetical protein